MRPRFSNSLSWIKNYKFGKIFTKILKSRLFYVHQLDFLWPVRFLRDSVVSCIHWKQCLTRLIYTFGSYFQNASISQDRVWIKTGSSVWSGHSTFFPSLVLNGWNFSICSSIICSRLSKLQFSISASLPKSHHFSRHKFRYTLRPYFGRNIYKQNLHQLTVKL